MLARRILGTILIAHGLAHAGPGMWAAERAPALIVTALWLVATLGFFFAGLLLCERASHPGRFARIAVTGAIGSIGLVALTGWNAVAVSGTVLSILLATLTVRLARTATERADSGLTNRSPGVPAARSGWGRRIMLTLSRAALVYVGLAIALRPLHSRWGSTAAERAMALPGDEIMTAPRYRLNHAITIHAPASMVWPWLLQIGQDRAGFYSYDWLERAIGDHVQNVDSIVPAWQYRAVGDLVRATQPDYLGGRLGSELGWHITQLDPGQAMVLQNWGAFVLHPIDAQTTRLHVRSLGDGRASVAAVPIAPFGLLIIEPAHFVMERGMLRGIKWRAEKLLDELGEP